MSALDFPSSPVNGQTFVDGPRTWTFNSFYGVWNITSQGIIGPTGYTGSQGVIGYTGSFGATGYTGSQGVIGYTGSFGATGYTGSSIGASTNTQIIFNDSGAANGSSNFIFNKTTNALDVTGSIRAAISANTGDSMLIASNINIGTNTTKYASLLFQGANTSGTIKSTGVVLLGPIDANYTSSYMAFQTRGSDAISERMRIDSSGNVGIGTSSPNAKLQVIGNVDIGGGGGTYQGIQLRNSDNSASVETVNYIDARNNLGTADAHMFFGHQTTGSSFIALGTTAAGDRNTDRRVERLRIDGTGFVGIGTTAPLTQLNVPASILVTSDGGYYGGGAYYASAAWRNAVAGQGGYAIRNTVGVFTIFTGASTDVAGTAFTSFAERLRIDGTGFVGIGTSSPAAKLEVSSTSAGATVEVLRLSNPGLGGNTAAQIKFTTASTNYGTISGGYGAAAPQMTFNLPNAGNYVWQGTSVEQMRLDSVGNLLVGATANPGVLNKSVVINSGADSLAGIVLQNNATGTGSTDGSHITIAATDLIITNAENAPIFFKTNNTERMRITAAGNLLVGTTTADNKLTVSASSANAAAGVLSLVNPNDGVGTAADLDFVIHSSATLATGRIRGLAAGADNYPMSFWTYGSGGLAEHMRIDNSGNVGIGTTAPVGRLTIQGAIGTSGINQGLGLLHWTGTQYGALGLNNSTGWPQLMARAGAGLTFHVNSDLLTTGEVMRINSAGDVSIAATGGLFSSANRGNLTIGGSSSSIMVLGTSTGTGTYLYHDQGTSHSELWNIANGYMRFGTSNIERIRITAAGDVGIGTTTPGFKLEVNGSFAATTKSFVIDHPTKPDMKLRYGSLEGPENGVYVRGKLNGNNIIELPDYWTGLVDEDTITVNLTPIGRKQDLFVLDISNNQITISGTNVNCFYTVFAERKDVEKIIVEFNNGN